MCVTTVRWAARVDRQPHAVGSSLRPTDRTARVVRRRVRVWWGLRVDLEHRLRRRLQCRSSPTWGGACPPACVRDDPVWGGGAAQGRRGEPWFPPLTLSRGSATGSLERVDALTYNDRTLTAPRHSVTPRDTSRHVRNTSATRPRHPTTHPRHLATQSRHIRDTSATSRDTSRHIRRPRHVRDTSATPYDTSATSRDTSRHVRDTSRHFATRPRHVRDTSATSRDIFATSPRHVRDTLRRNVTIR